MFLSLSALNNRQANQTLKIAKVLRIFRAVKALKITLRTRGARILILTLRESLWPLLSIVSMSLLLFIVLSIVGMQFLSGSLHYCTDLVVLSRDDCTGVDPRTKLQRRWMNASFNFDWIGEAMLAVLVIVTQDKWQDLLFSAVDSTGKYSGPIQNHQEWMFVFFFIIIVVGTFFQLNIWTGVFVKMYYKAAEGFEKAMREQEISSGKPDKWPRRDDLPFLEAADHNISIFQAWRQGASYRTIAYKFSMNTTFDMFIALCIVLNILFMSLESYKPSEVRRSSCPDTP